MSKKIREVEKLAKASETAANDDETPVVTKKVSAISEDVSEANDTAA